ncbi:MAG TPA: dienelactone hydrolase family protein [Myxococcaceae bacterium]|nr:dienelactone hydrolase family protein [Myxococcaceae bacterium]
MAVCRVFLCALAGISGCASDPQRASETVRAPSWPVPTAERPAQQVEFQSGQLRLHGLLWLPAGSGPFPAVVFNHGSGGATAGVTAGMPIAEAAARLAPLFTRRGFAFFYPFRRGQGPSADVAPFMQDLLTREEQAHGKEARRHLQDTLMQTEQLDDVLAALAFVRTVPEVDAQRLVVAGHSFGGQLSVLAAARVPSLRAGVTSPRQPARGPALRKCVECCARRSVTPGVR